MRPWPNADAVSRNSCRILDDRPLAVVDAAVAAALDGSLLEDGHAAAAFVGTDERRPHARAAVADHDDVGFGVPVLGDGVLGLLDFRERVGGRIGARGATGQSGGAGESGAGDHRALQKRTARKPFAFHSLSSLRIERAMRRATRAVRRHAPLACVPFAFQGTKRRLFGHRMGDAIFEKKMKFQVNHYQGDCQSP